MRLVYTFLICTYGFLIRFTALFNQKARQWSDGRHNIFARLAASLKSGNRTKSPVVWFHVSSLGEFEQGRPVIEAFKKRWPEKRILLTFFSPSGYEVRRNYEHADYIFYLPLDTPGNVKKFLDIVQPEMSFFIKYDFWFNYLDGLHDRSIPVYFISAIFRENQYFFRWYGRWACLHLRNVSHFFVQNVESENLLNSVGVKQVTVTGDTRFDRVAAIAAQNSPIPLIEKFCAGKKVFVAGSSWEPDEELFIPLVQQKGRDLKYIIAPHDTSARRIHHIRGRIDRHVILYSELNDDNAASADILVIDSVGLLSKMYRYATIAYIGGGFGAGIHNIQEPVTFGIPVFFGPNYQKFKEARDLVNLGGAIMISSAGDLLKKVIEITENPHERDRLSGICSKYIAENTGATEKVIKYLEKVSG